MASLELDLEARSTQSGDSVTQLVEETMDNNLIEVIETVIGSLDSDNTAMVNHGEDGHLWKFKYGSVEVFVQLSGLTPDDTLTVWSVVLKLPVNNEAQLLRKLMEMNWSDTMEARFAVLNNEVVVLCTRNLEDVSPTEISRSITIAATIADQHDDALQAQFAAA